MPSIAVLKKLQAASGLFFGTFLAMHLLSHYTLNFGWDAANGRLNSFRALYQNSIFEVLLFLSVFTHMYANLSVYKCRQKIRSTKQDDKKPAPEALELKGHRIAGYIIALSIFGHVTATRLGPILVLDDPSEYDYSFVAKANELVPGYLFLVYLAIFGMAGGWHLIYGTRSAITTLSGSSTVGKPFPMVLKVMAMSNHLLIIGAVLALGGFRCVIDMETKAELHEKLYSALGLHR
jgi:succinate dehydrogenase/fumarate reductase cytochrome b subunit